MEAADDLQVEIVTPAERARLVRLCARLSGNAGAAEDLAQETLLEAWRNRQKLHDPSGRSAWTAQIARNVCLRWRQAQVRRTGRSLHGGGAKVPSEDLVDPCDVEIELERHELADLLDRACALLPRETRAVLIERYIHESSHAEIADRLRLSEGAVRVRVHRGKLALQRVIRENFAEDAAAYGWSVAVPSVWESTRIWCPLCGGRRLTMLVDRALGTVTSRCDSCCSEADDNVTQTEDPGVAEGIRSYRAIVSRQLAVAARWRERLGAGSTLCRRCHHPTGVDIVEQPAGGLRPSEYGWLARCRRCGATSFAATHGLALSVPEVQLFWQRHPRMHALREREVEVDGAAALVVRFASSADSARLDLVAARTDFQVLGIHEWSSPAGRS